jgi:vancomycin resistance protein YoaR
VSAFLVIVVGGGIFWATQHYSTRLLPGTTIDGVPVGGLLPEEARVAIERQQPELGEFEVSLLHNDLRRSTSTTTLGLERTVSTTIEHAFAETHTPSFFSQLALCITTRLRGKTYRSAYQFNQDAVTKFVESLQSEIESPGTTTSATLRYSNTPSSIAIERGVFGKTLLVSETVQALLSSAGPQDLELPLVVATTSTELSDAEVIEYQERVAPLVGRAARLESEYGSLVIDDVALVKMTAFPRGLHQSAVTATLAEWETRFGKEAQDAEFSFDPSSLVVTTFTPDRPQITLNLPQAAVALEEAMERELSDTALARTTNPEQYFTIPLPLSTLPAKRTLANTNDLGITERIAFGESEYANSIPTRVHNVAHTANKINNTIVPPGAEFSFNKSLGEVSRATGFQPAYIIRNGRTELGDGGGVCQVSTTLFRALLDGGLLITKRLPHSYRVSYYELNAKPGLDATVYAGEVDLRFKNDTDHHILIHTSVDSENRYMSVEIYGTSDGLTAEVVEHLVWGSTPPLATQYIPDPTLAPGKRKQIDWAVGGVKTSFINVIKDANGVVIREDKYTSNYRPWAAKFLVGVEPTQ